MRRLLVSEQHDYTRSQQEAAQAALVAARLYCGAGRRADCGMVRKRELSPDAQPS
ncbi:MAG: hypothetical protein ABI442_14455 [Gemmatimonadaceae bacterium]